MEINIPNAFKAVLLSAAVLVPSACGTATEGGRETRGQGDAPVGAVDDRASLVINFPDAGSNFYIKCRDGVALISEQGSESSSSSHAFYEPESPMCDGDTVIVKPFDRVESGFGR